MFSYRHAFHAGNHADVLKHTALIALMQYLTQKDGALMVIDTHAGAGLYRLDGDHSLTSGEALRGVCKLASADKLAPALEQYLTTLRSFNGKGTKLNIYPGSPFIAQRFLSGRDKLKLFELHPSDYKLLRDHIAQLEVGRQVALARADGFAALKTLLPPPSRRALVLCDPSYEIKTDYNAVAACMADALKRFATGVYAIWYPIIARPEAHALPRKLKTLAGKAGKSWLQATLTVKSSKSVLNVQGDIQRAGLPASGMFIINPPHTLKATLQPALAQMAALLAQDKHAGFTLTTG